MRPPVERAVDEHSGADAGAEREEDEVVHLLCSAPPFLSERSAIRVLLDEHRHRVPILELLAQWHVAPAAQVARLQHTAGVVDVPRNGDP